MRMQKVLRRLLGPVPLAGLPVTIGLVLLAGCGDGASKPAEPSGESPPPAVKTEPVAAKPAAKPASGSSKVDLGPDMSVKERRALKKAGKFKER